MTEAHLSVGINQDLLIRGIAEASRNYEAALEEIRPDILTLPGGPSDDERRIIREINPDIYVPDVLDLTEVDEELFATQEVRQELERGYTEPRYAIDVAVGEAVAYELSRASRKAARDTLPQKAVAVVELNANRGFPRGYEDSLGCYGIRQNHLGHIVIDAYYHGSDEVSSSEKEQKDRIDFMPEPGPGHSLGLDRNAARILVRPAYPLLHDPTAHDIGQLVAREVYEARLRGQIDDKNVHPPYSVLRGEYRICRAVAIVHELHDWHVEDFESREDAAAKYSA